MLMRREGQAKAGIGLGPTGLAAIEQDIGLGELGLGLWTRQRQPFHPCRRLERIGD